MRIYLIGFIILALLGAGGYVIKLQRDNTILKENAVKLESAISEQKQVIENKIKQIEVSENITVAAEVYPFLKFHKGEDYHQDFEKRNPNHPYIQRISIPRLRSFQKNFPQLLKANH